MYDYDYYSQIEDDIREYIADNGIDSSVDFDKLYSDLWNFDGVTGGGSGSYFFNSFSAAEMVAANYDMLQECVDNGFLTVEEVGLHVLSGDFELLDVCIRQNLLHFCLTNVIENLGGENYD